MEQGKNCTIWHPELSVLLDCQIGDDCTIHAHVWIGNKVAIGNRCKVQAMTFIPEGVTIGDDVFIGPRVTFTNDKHPPSEHWSETLVCDGVSIGAGAVILPGITLNEGCKIGAGAVVTRSVPAWATVVGNPARIYKLGEHQFGKHATQEKKVKDDVKGFLKFVDSFSPS